MSDGASDTRVEVVWECRHMHSVDIHVGRLIVILRGPPAGKQTHRIEEIESTLLASIQLGRALIVLESLIQRLRGTAKTAQVGSWIIGISSTTFRGQSFIGFAESCIGHVGRNPEVVIIAVAVGRSYMKTMLCVHSIAGEWSCDVGEHLWRGPTVIL